MQKKEFQFAGVQSTTSSMPKKKRPGKNLPARNSKNPGKPLLRTKGLVNKVAKVIDCKNLCNRRSATTKSELVNVAKEV